MTVLPSTYPASWVDAEAATAFRDHESLVPPAVAPADDLSHLRFVHLSFEGPDRYSSAGGLGVRVTNLARALAERGAAVDLFFVGDPDLPGVEERDGVVMHRWSQAISANARAGVYDDEERKIEDWCAWLPGHLAGVVGADRAAGRRTVVLAEDWHTMWPLVALHDELVGRGLRDAPVLAWTANNRFGFDRLDFGRLRDAATILTISRAMKHLLWSYGVNPLVVPNGIPDDFFEPVESRDLRSIRDALPGRVVLAKVGRWDPDKRWHMALDAVARFRDRGEPAVLVARGWNGSEAATSHHRALRAHAAELDLPWTVAGGTTRSGTDLAAALAAVAPTASGVVEVASPVAGPPLRALYAASDAVLANSGFEPFGLVGLEAMATRSVVVTGSTGEDYLVPFQNGFALDTDDAAEIVGCFDWMRRSRGREASLRAAAHVTARRYRWADVIERLVLALGL
jgi:glycosyltransferase involved in cell wall biosynthesis